jgi:intein-encoded DNA endonuclease-like protein
MGIKYAVNDKAFDTWSPTMAYVLGFLYADGTIFSTPSNRGKYVAVLSVDRDIIEAIKSFLVSKHLITIEIPASINRQTRYRLRIGSHILYESLMRRGLYPSKSLTIEMPRIPKKYLPAFIRGYFDGDGCVHIEKGRTKDQKREIIKRLRIVFTSGSKQFLEQLSAEISKNYPVGKAPVYNSHRSFQLRYSTASSIELFKMMYKNQNKPFHLIRKLNTFRRYFTLRPEKVDSKVRGIIMA